MRAFIEAVIFLVLVIQSTNGVSLPGDGGNECAHSLASVNQPIVGTPLGLEDGTIPDSSMTASNAWSSYHGPRRGRLNLARDGKLRGGWSASPRDYRWIQVDLSSSYMVAGVVTQGRYGADQWVTSFKIACSMDGITFETIQDQLSNGTDKVFPGNCDRHTPVFNPLPVAKECRYVRLLPITWYDHISLRMELYGIGPRLDGVSLGLESGTIPDSSLTASDSWDFLHGPHRGRLNLVREKAPGKKGKLRGGWSAPLIDDLWIQVDLLAPYWIGRVVTQGRYGANQWLTSFKLACSMDGQTFDTVKESPNQPETDKVFPGNIDRHTPVFNHLPVAIVCRYVRLIPLTWNHKIGLRFDLYGEGPLMVP